MFALRNLWRDLKSRELLVLLLALSVAVTALTAVGFFTNRIERGVRIQAGEVLAADLRIEASNDLAPRYFAEAQRRGVRSARVDLMPTAVFAGTQSQLISLVAASDAYPLRGTVRVASFPFGPAQAVTGVPAAQDAWADSRIMARLNLQVGSPITIGAATFRITRVLDYRPDQGSAFVGLAPPMLIARGSLPATELVQPGSRVTYAGLFAGDVERVAEFRRWLEHARKPGERIEEIEESSRQLGSAIERSTRFLNLASLASVLLGAVAVAMGARRYTQRHIDTVALMKCMGASQAFVLQATLLELLLVGLIAVAAGTGVGYFAQEGLAWLLRDLIRNQLPQATFAPVPLALATVIAMLAGFALPPLLQLKNTPPLRVLRKSVEAPKLALGASYLIGLGALLAIVWVLVRDSLLVAYLFAGVLAVAAVLGLAGAGLVFLTHRLRGGVGVAWRYGLANVSRRGADSVVQIVAFGLGLMVLLLLAVVRGDLLQDWRRTLPDNVPNNFLINIKPDERAPLLAYLQDRHLGTPPLYPMVRARIVGVNGVSAQNLRGLGDRGKGFIEREQNLTWSDALPSDNRIVAGRWWSHSDSGQALVSISSEYQEDLHVGVGDIMQFDVAGEPVSARIASVRKVRWDTFRPNFFLVFPPGVLDGAAGTYMTSVFLRPSQRPELVGLVRQFPSVSVIDVDAILKQIRSVIDRASLAVQYVFLFTLAAGFVVLLAAVQSTRDERRYESAMLRTLGARRSTVLQGIAAEFATLGFLSGTLAAVGASIIGWVLARKLFAVPYAFDPWLWLIGLASGTLLVGLAGVWATRRAASASPLLTLRRN